MTLIYTKYKLFKKACDLSALFSVYDHVYRDQKDSCSSARHCYKKVQVGKDQEKAQSEKDSHSKNRGGKKPN